MIPKGNDDPTIQSYLIYLSLRDRAKKTVDTENKKCRSSGQLEMQQRPDYGESIIALMHHSFPVDPVNEYLLNFMRLVRTYWRDPTSPSENSREYVQRLDSIRDDAEAQYAGLMDVQCYVCNVTPFEVVTELTMRMIIIAGLPTEVQAYISTQRVVRWDEPRLGDADICKLTS